MNCTHKNLGCPFVGTTQEELAHHLLHTCKYQYIKQFLMTKEAELDPESDEAKELREVLETVSI
jgi:hypothetical protein